MAAIHLMDTEKQQQLVQNGWLSGCGSHSRCFGCGIHRQGSLLVRGWSNKKNQTLQNRREALEPSAAHRVQLTLVSW